MLFSKSLTYVLTATWPSQFFDWYSWAVVVAFVFTGGFWVRCTSVGLRRFSSSLIIPLMQVLLLPAEVGSRHLASLPIPCRIIPVLLGMLVCICYHLTPDMMPNSTAVR